MREFELTKYLRASKKLDLEGIDFDAVPRYPLSREEVRVLTYMMDIETHTIVYLRDLLTTPAAYDPEITAFLSLWAYEEFWHGEALSRFLRAAGERVSPDRPGAIRRAVGLRDVVGTIAKMAVARAVPDFVAVHMTWGAINELSTLNGYRRVVAGTRHPILVELLARIVKDERRHYAFYYNQARCRLEGNVRAQRLVRWTLDRFWEPVGSGVRPQAETDFVVRHLFGDEPGREASREMERELSKLPGLDGMRLIRRASARVEKRAGGRRRAPVAFPVAAGLT
ncbi:MAG: ferritin-like domain-containing protein [Actinomycetota bacterium]